MAGQELAIIDAQIDGHDLDAEGEAGWARFVEDAEEAISREHTLWRASRGVRLLPPRTIGAQGRRAG